MGERRVRIAASQGLELTRKSSGPPRHLYKDRVEHINEAGTKRQFMSLAARIAIVGALI